LYFVFFSFDALYFIRNEIDFST